MKKLQLESKSSMPSFSKLQHAIPDKESILQRSLLDIFTFSKFS